MTDKTSAARRRLLGAALAATVAAAGLLPAAAASARQDAADQAEMGDQAAGQMGEHGRRGSQGSQGLHARVDRLLALAGASPQQKAKIEQILKNAFTQTEPLRRKAAEAHQDLARLLTAPRIDRAAIERDRADHISALDQSGRIMVKAFADAAEVLTPQQRARIAMAVSEGRRTTHH